MKQKFENLGVILSRSAQKKIGGGLEEGGTYTINCTPAPGYHIESPGNCTGTLAACTSDANAWCSDINNHCYSCTVS